MKYLITTIFLLGISASCFAGTYVIIDNQHTHQGCDYYDVTIYDDNGTPGDRSDDIELGSGTINSCDRSVPGDPNDDTALVTGSYSPEPGCTFYEVEIVNHLKQTVTVGIAASGGC